MISRKNKENFLIFILLYLAFLFPVIRANYYYIDDIYRAQSGVRGWSVVGRPLADLFFYILNFQSYAFDLAPLPQILAVIAMAAASVHLLNATQIPSSAGFLPISFLVYNPFFLENLSYRFDAPIMAFAISIAISSAIIVNKNTSATNLVFSVVGLTSSLCFYQPASGAFIIVSAFLLLNSEKNFKPSCLIEAARVLLVLIVGCVLYVFISRYFLDSDYSSLHGGVSKNLSDFYSTIMENIPAFYKKHSVVLLGSMQTATLVIFFAIGGFCALFQKMIFLRNSSFLTRLISVPFSCLLILIMALSVPGLMLVLDNPIFDNRVLLSFGALIACLSISFVRLSYFAKLPSVAQICLAIVLFSQLVFSFAYGNVLATQVYFEAQVARRIVEDVVQDAPPSNSVMIVRGTMPVAPISRKIYEEFPAIQSLVRPHMQNSWFWGDMILRNNGLPYSVLVANDANRLADQADAQKAMSDRCEGRLVTRRPEYDLIQIDNIYVVDFLNLCR